jgi:hypothetical protein
MTPEQLAKSGSEDALQMALFAALNDKILRLKIWPNAENLALAEKLRWVHAIPNGGHRHKAVAGKLKATGAKAGVLDVFCPVPRVTDREYGFNTLFSGAYGVLTLSGFVCEAYHGLYVEMKTADRRNHKNGGLSDVQVEFRDFIGLQGYGHVVCYGWEEALSAILTYLGATK